VHRFVDKNKEVKVSISVAVENIKCAGCANGIKQKLLTLSEVESVDVDVEAGLVKCEVVSSENEDEIFMSIKQTLTHMGYPEVGSVDGLKAAGAKAKSYVSCAVGKMTDSSSNDGK